MIDFLKGNLVNIEYDFVVIDVGGIGYRVFCSQPLMFSAQLDQVTQLFIHYHVREDAHLLYGFATREEQSLFRLLLEVSGIGPKVALSALASGSPSTVMNAIMQENIVYLTQLQGIGKKTAQRIILDLKDKVSHLTTSSTSVHVSKLPHSPATHMHQSNWIDAKDALIGWGYTESELQKAWILMKENTQDDAPVDTLIKQALQHLNKP
jgi:Holliday junction DNA helicase RuvA